MSAIRQRPTVIVAATADRSPLERIRGAQAATAIAEHFRDRGGNVLLVIDSLTAAAGEQPVDDAHPRVEAFVDLAAAPPRRLADIETARREIIETATRLIAEGKLTKPPRGND